MQTPYRIQMGMAIAKNVKGSVLGVMTAAKKAIPTTIPRHIPRIRCAVRIPTRLRNTSTSGNRNDTPKASRVKVANDR